MKMSDKEMNCMPVIAGQTLVEMEAVSGQKVNMMVETIATIAPDGAGAWDLVFRGPSMKVKSVPPLLMYLVPVLQELPGAGEARALLTGDPPPPTQES
jgi:hypothetical protein